MAAHLDIVLYGLLSMILLWQKPRGPDQQLLPGRGETEFARFTRGQRSNSSSVSWSPALVGSLDEAGIGIAMSVSATVAVAILLANTHPIDPRRRRRGCPRVTADQLSSRPRSGQLLPVPYDSVGLLATLSVSATLAWLALAAVFLHDEMAQVMGMIRKLETGRRCDDPTPPPPANPDGLYPHAQRRREPQPLPRSLEQQTAPPHVVVADNGDGEGCSSLLRERFPRR